MFETKSCGSGSRARRTRFSRNKALARPSCVSRSSAARSRSTRTVSSRRSRCNAAPTRPAAISSAETMEESNSRTRCQSSKPMAPTYSPSTMSGTMAEVRALSLVMLTLSKPFMRIGAEHHALARLQHRAVFIRERLIAFGELAAGVGQRFVDPLGLDLEQFLAVGADSAKASAVRSTCAASPRSLSTSGMTFMASGDPSSRRLACAEAASSRSRCWRNWWLRMPSAAAAKSIGLMLMAG